MSIQIEKYVTKCRNMIEEKSAPSAGALNVRIPNRPVMITFLGAHPEEGKRKFDYSLQVGWPTASFRLLEREKVYDTPEAFLKAIEETDQEGMTEIDRTIRSATSDPGLPTPNLLLVYFIDFDSDDTEKFINLLDRQHTTPIGGNKERLIFAIGRMTSNKSFKNAASFIDKITTVAKNPESLAEPLWKNTSCVMLSDYMYGGTTLTDEEFTNNYSLAMDILLMQHSVRIPQDKYMSTLLPRVTDDNNQFLTATLRRESKPSDQIARTVLFKYLRYGISLANLSSSNNMTVLSLQEAAQKALKERFKSLVESNAFPDDAAMVHFPNGAANGDDAGLKGGQDKTMGTWKLFCDKYFSKRVVEAFGDKSEMINFYKRYFSKDCDCSCGVIQKLFPSFKASLDEVGEKEFMGITKPSPSASLHDWGLYNAKVALGEVGFPALKEAISELSVASGSYVTMLSTLSGQVTPTDDSVLIYYGNVVDGHMGARKTDETFEDILKRPCSEDELAAELDDFIESVTTLPQLRMNFFEELRARLADDGANNMIKQFLQLSSHILRNDARMRVGIVQELIEASMFDSDMLGVSGENHFELCGTNGMDRVVLYSFDSTDL